MYYRVKYKIGQKFGNQTGESIAGQPLKDKLEEAKRRPLLGALGGHTEALIEKAGVCQGQPGMRGHEEIKGKTVLNEAWGRWG